MINVDKKVYYFWALEPSGSWVITVYSLKRVWLMKFFEYNSKFNPVKTLSIIWLTIYDIMHNLILQWNMKFGFLAFDMLNSTFYKTNTHLIS